MKFNVTMKTPNVLEYAIKAAVERHPHLRDDEKTDEVKAIAELCEKWFAFGETVTLEIDTETDTCRVVPKG